MNDVHSLLGHPLKTDSVFLSTPSAQTAHSRGQQDAPQGGPPHIDVLSFRQQLGKMGVIPPDGPAAVRRSG